LFWKARAWLIAALVAVAMADDCAALEPNEEDRSFDIPSKPLSAALSDYSAVTGLGVLVDGGMTAGRMSAAIKGAFSPAAALQALLEPTGLTVRYVTPTAFTLVPAPMAPARSVDPAREHYFAAVQAAVVGALCQHAETRPGQYRSVVRLWINRSGMVQRSEIFGSTGQPERDAALEKLLVNLDIQERPSFNLPQPVTLVLLPRGAQSPADCVADAGQRR
jgi:hypothetical protein